MRASRDEVIPREDDLPMQASRNEVIPQEDDDVADWDLSRPDQLDGPSDARERMEIDEDPETTQMSGQTKPENRDDFDLQSALPQAYPTPSLSLSENGALEDFVGLTVNNLADNGPTAQFEGVKGNDTIEMESPNWSEYDEDRFNDFNEVSIVAAWQGAFLKERKFKAHKRDLPPPPESYRELERHPLRKAFEEAQKQHLRKGS
jgi:hypothetical protein